MSAYTVDGERWDAQWRNTFVWFKQQRARFGRSSCSQGCSLIILYYIYKINPEDLSERCYNIRIPTSNAPRNFFRQKKRSRKITHNPYHNRFVKPSSAVCQLPVASASAFVSLFFVLVMVSSEKIKNDRYAGQEKKRYQRQKEYMGKKQRRKSEQKNVGIRQV